MIFLKLPTGNYDPVQVAINIDEIASYSGHTYSHQDWTEVVLKNGVAHDCHISVTEFERRMSNAMAMGADQ